MKSSVTPAMVTQRFPIALLSVALYAQAPQTEVAAPRFATASVKADTSGHNGIGNKFDPVMMRWTSTPLRVLVQQAYGLRSYQIVGWPSSLDSDKYNIDAKTESPTTTKQKYEMLQTLIVERFGLKFHREMRDLQGYSLVVGKNGPKLREVREGEVGSSPAGTTIQRGLVIGHQVRMMDWVGLFSGELGCPFEDNTGLTGRYDFKLEWSPDERQPNSFGEPGDPSGPSIFAAVQDQLGLKLEAKKFPVEMFIVDHVDKTPTAN
jgi:uncharacterized protein (TIGR03435 family)